MKKQASLAALLALAAFALPASAKTYYVDDDAENDDTTGLSATAPFKTIQAAIDKAAAGSTILVAPGTYAPVDFKGKKLAIKSTDGADETVIDGQGAEGAIGIEMGAYETVAWKPEWAYIRKFKNAVTKKTLVVNMYYVRPQGSQTILSITPPKGGKFFPDEPGDPSYGVVYSPFHQWVRDYEYEYDEASAKTSANHWYVVSEDDVWLSGSARITLGKALAYVAKNVASVTGFTVTGCEQAARGGSLVSCTVASNAFRNLDVDDEEPWDYAGSMLYGTTATDTAILKNNAEILIQGGSLNRCVVDGNVARSILIWKPTLLNSLVSGNQSPEGILGYSTVYNSTIAGNFLLENDEYPGAAVMYCDVYGSILAGNANHLGDPANVQVGYDGVREVSVASDYENYTIVYDEEWQETRYAKYTMVNSFVADRVVEQKGNNAKKGYKNSTGNIAGDPCFIDPGNNDYHLAPTSPCKDAGADYTKKTGKFDLDGGARKVGKVDMGAYELQPQTAVPADYDGDGKTDAAFYFAASGQWWIFQSRDGLRTISLPDRNAVPCPADYDDEDGAEPAYFTAAAKEPAFVRVSLDGEVLERTAFGAKGATPVAAKLPGKTKATFGVYTANAKKPQFSFPDGPTVTFGAKGAKPVVADFTGDGTDELGVYTSAASKPAFSALQGDKAYATATPFEIPSNPFYPAARKSIPLGTKGSVPCCADYDGDGTADFAAYSGSAAAPAFARLLSSTKFSELWTLPMGSKGNVAVPGVYETEHGPAAPAVWTGSRWTYVKSDYTDDDVRLLGD